jgi:hypothetical protein
MLIIAPQAAWCRARHTPCSIAEHAAARHRRGVWEEGIHNPPWCLARSFPCTLCHEIRLAPARGTRTLTRTTRRKVNTRLRAVNGRPSPDNHRAAAFAGGIAEGAQDWLVIAPPPQSIVKSVTWSALDRHPASPCKLLPFLLRSESTSPLFLPAPIVKHFLTP